MFEKYGLVQLGSDTPRITNPNKRLYVLIHPYWAEIAQDTDISQYVPNIEKLINESSSPILTLDDDCSTVSRYSRLNPRGGRFFLPSSSHRVEPPCGWDATARIIMQFEPEEVVFGGSRLVVGGNNHYTFCVGVAYRNLQSRVPRTRIDETICDIQYGPL